jgi:hypothetical protein
MSAGNKTELTFPIWLRIRLPEAEYAGIRDEPEALLVELYAEQLAAFKAYQSEQWDRAWQRKRAAQRRQENDYYDLARFTRKNRGNDFIFCNRSEHWVRLN